MKRKKSIKNLYVFLVLFFCNLKKGEIMSKKKKISIVFIIIAIISFVGSILTHTDHGEGMTLQEAMKEAVLHEVEKVSLFGIIDVNPSVIAGFIVTAVLVLFALIIRFIFIPKFKRVPGKFQMLIEQIVLMFTNLAKTNSPHKYGFLGPYIFAAGIYIAIGTLFELVGLQVISITGSSITLPAPLSDLNAAISLGFLSYFVIMSGGISSHGPKGILKTLKDFSLPISMSFRLFGALVSGLLVMDLVYHTIYLSYGIPVIVAVLFTLLHAIIQSYVLTLLTSIFYGEVSEVHKEA